MAVAALLDVAALGAVLTVSYQALPRSVLELPLHISLGLKIHSLHRGEQSYHPGQLRGYSIENQGPDGKGSSTPAGVWVLGAAAGTGGRLRKGTGAAEACRWNGSCARGHGASASQSAEAPGDLAGGGRRWRAQLWPGLLGRRLGRWGLSQACP